MEIPDRYRIINVWISKPPALKQEIIDFWMKEKALPTLEAAKKRVEEVALIAREESGNIIAISTVYEKFNKQLENFFYYYRSYVAPQARKSKLAASMIVETRDFLEANFIKKVKTRPIGMMVEVENKALQTYKNEAVWPLSKMVYIGRSEKGNHVRVYYFQDARIS